MELNDFLCHLECVAGEGQQFSALCPAHDDNKASLSIKRGDDGRILLNCHAGCTVEEVISALGLAMADLFSQHTMELYPIHYNYNDADGNLVAQKVRTADKKFSWRRPDGDGSWITGRGGPLKVLYNLQAVAAAKSVWIVEGEKDADLINSFGVVATCNPDGAGPKKWHPEFTEMLRGKSCCIISDNDDQGRAHAENIAQQLSGVAKKVKLLDLTQLWTEIPEHGDVSDFVEEFGKHRAKTLLSQYAKKAVEYTLSSETMKGPSLIKASDVPYEEPHFLLPPYVQLRKLNLVQGDNGVGKTAFLCGIAAHVSTGESILNTPVQKQGNVLIVSVEDDISVLRGRIDANGGDLNKCIFLSNAGGLTFNSPKVEQCVKETKAVLLIFDPFQAFLGAGVDMHRGNQTRPILAKLAEMAGRNDCAIAINAHMSKGGVGGAAVNRSLGSVDIPAAMRSIIQLGRNPENEKEVVAVHVKCSNAPPGPSIAFTIGDRGGVTWKGFSTLTVNDLETAQKRKESGVEYEQEPIVAGVRMFIKKNPRGGKLTYEEFHTFCLKTCDASPWNTAREAATIIPKLKKEILHRDQIIIQAGVYVNRARGLSIKPCVPTSALQKE